MRSGWQVRVATTEDGVACAGMYADYVMGAAISFGCEPPTTGAMAERIMTALRTHAWLVAEDSEGAVVGYAYGSRFRDGSPASGLEVGRWPDVHWMQRRLGSEDRVEDAPGPPR